MSDVQPVPDDYPQVAAYLCVDGAQAAIDFLGEVFGATARMTIPTPEGGIGHAEVVIGSGLVMLSDEFPEMEMIGPKKLGGSPVTLSVYVQDVDAVFAKAIAAGAEAVNEPEDQFYGDRSAQFKDPFGHRWNIATHIEDVDPEEMARRSAAMFEGMSG